MPLANNREQREYEKFLETENGEVAVRVATFGDTSSFNSPESATDATGQDFYSAILVPTITPSHILISNEGSNPARISFDGGVTTHLTRVPGASILSLDDVNMGGSIFARNADAGNNYTNLTITVW